MIVGLSTSSPWTSVAAFEESGQILFSERRHAPHAASGAIIELLQEMESRGLRLINASGFCADVGPGSFTGVRVGVVMAKTFGYVFGKPCAGVSAFDLISEKETVCVPSKKNEVFIREPAHSPYLCPLPLSVLVMGYGSGSTETFPDAVRFSALEARLEFQDAMMLVPKYLHEPSISVPKKPYGGVHVP